MRKWIADAVQRGSLQEASEIYLYGRGCKPEVLQGMGFFNWNPRDLDPAPDQDFTKKYGPRGERLRGWLIWPLYTPRGILAGFEGRATTGKVISCYLLSPEYHWNSAWIGMPQGMARLWAGGAAWIVEGLFDLLPMQWIVPEQDAVLASRRAGLTEDQMNFLIRFASSVNMVYDRDAAGKRESWKAMKALRAVGVRCQEIRYGGGKDPGVVWDAGGVVALQENFCI